MSATTTVMYWQLRVPDEADLVVGRGGGFEARQADATSLAWEKEFIDRALSMVIGGFQLLPFANRSFGDVSAGALFFDFYKMIIGYSMMFIFTVCMLGKFNRIEFRLYLSVGGILGVVMGYIISLGVGSLCGYSLSPLTIILPFVLLGKLILVQYLFDSLWTTRIYSIVTFYTALLVCYRDKVK